MAARVGNPAAFLDGMEIGRSQFRESVSPVGITPEGRGGVDDLGVTIPGGRRHFPGSSIRQAQEGHIGHVDFFQTGIQILPEIRTDGKEFDILPLLQPLGQPQTSRPFAAIDKHFKHHDHPSFTAVSGAQFV